MGQLGRQVVVQGGLAALDATMNQPLLLEGLANDRRHGGVGALELRIAVGAALSQLESCRSLGRHFGAEREDSTANGAGKAPQLLSVAGSPDPLLQARREQMKRSGKCRTFGGA